MKDVKTMIKETTLEETKDYLQIIEHYLNKN